MRPNRRQLLRPSLRLWWPDRAGRGLMVKAGRSPAEAMRLSELARATDVPARTVRYYVDRGLIRPSRRTEGGYRLFGENAVRQLRFLRRLQGLGLTLRDLQQLLRAAERQSCGQSSATLTRRLESQLSTVDRRLEELGQVRHELASILARERGGCSDELCLCNHEQLTQVESRRPAPVPAPA